MVFDSYLLPSMPNHTKSILDYDVIIQELKPEATFFVPAETGKSSRGESERWDYSALNRQSEGFAPKGARRSFVTRTHCTLTVEDPDPISKSRAWKHFQFSQRGGDFVVEGKVDFRSQEDRKLGGRERILS